MAQILFAQQIQKKDPRKPSWRGIARVSFTRPAIGAKVDPIQKEAAPAKEVVTRESLKVGTIVIILDGDHAGRRGVVVADKGAGQITVAGIDFGAFDICQCYLIATSTSLDVAGVNPANAESAIAAAAGKIAEMADYLKAPFTLKKGDRPHLMKF